MDVFLQVIYSTLSGFTIAAAIPSEFYKFGCPVLTLIGLIPFYFAIKNSKNFFQALLNGFVQTFITHIFSSYWLGFFRDYAILTLLSSALGTGLQGAALGLLFYLPYSRISNSLKNYSLSKGYFYSCQFRILYFAGVYTLYEWIKSSSFLGYPWGTIPCATYKWFYLTQIADITGVYGITFIISLINGFFAEASGYFWNKLQKSDRNFTFYLSKSFGLIFSLTALSLIYGIYQYNKVRKPQKYVTTVMIQQNYDPWKQETDNDTILLSQKLTEEKLNQLKDVGNFADLVVWSEGVLKYPFPGSLNYYNVMPVNSPLLKFVDKTNVPFIIGGSYIKDAQNKKYFNAALCFDKDGNFRGVYGKNHLVPFAEAIPGMENPVVKEIMSKVIGITAGWTPGDQYTIFEIPCKNAENRKLSAEKYIDLSKTYEQQVEEENKPPLVKISTPICFDDAFPDILTPLFNCGTELFVNITDDSWSLKESAEYQHFVVASYASIEYRTTMLRSANSGYSVVITPEGKILAEEPLFKESSMSVNVPVYEHIPTIYSRFGNWLPVAILILIFAYSIYMYLSFVPDDYIPSERKKSKKNKKNKK